MYSLRALLRGLLGVLTVATVLAAQELRDTIGPLEQKANPVTLENPIPPRTRSVVPSYPAVGREVRATATVVLAVTIDESGCVAEIRRGPDPMLTTPASLGPTQTTLTSAADALVRAAAAALRRWQYDTPARPPITFSVAFTFKPDADTTSTQIAAAVPLPPLPIRPRPPEPVRAGSILMSPRLVTRVEPVYPPQALAARVEGMVIVEARVDATGRVTNATVLRSIPLLDQAALDAVRQWVYAPMCLEGGPIPSILTVPVSFNLP
jgi:TonB family protein